MGVDSLWSRHILQKRLVVDCGSVCWSRVSGGVCRGEETGQRNEEQGLNRGRTLVKDLYQVWRR